MAHFQLDEENKKVIQCPAGNKPYKTRFYHPTGIYRASYPKSTCENFPLKTQCGVTFPKKSAYVMVSEKTVTRATHRQKMSTEEYRQLAKIRNGENAFLPYCVERMALTRCPPGDYCAQRCALDSKSRPSTSSECWKEPFRRRKLSVFLAESLLF